MTIPRTTARKLTTDTEYTLVEESFSPNVSGLSDKALAQRAKRARAARDKYRALAERQTRESTGKSAPRGTRPAQGNDNTVRKQQLFEETLSRFEKRLSALNAAQEKRDAAQPPSLSGIVRKAAKAVSARKTAKSKEAVPASKRTTRSRNTSAIKGGAEGDANASEAIPAPNPKGPQFPRNAHERGRQSSMQRRAQAKSDSR